MPQGYGLHPDQLQRIDHIYQPFHHAPTGVICIGTDTCCLRVNNAFANALGYQPNELQGQSLARICQPHQWPTTQIRLNAVFAGQLSGYQLLRGLLRKDHSLCKASLAVAPITDDQHTVIAAIIILSAVQPHQEHRYELRKFRYALECSASAVLITDAAGSIEYANPSFINLTGYSNTELLGKTPAMLRSPHTPLSTYQQVWSRILQGKQWRGTLRNRRRNGSEYWSFQSIAPIHDEAGTLINIVSVSDDITGIKNHEAQMEQLAYYDPLTGLGNRRLLRNALQRQTEHPSSQPSALLLLDLDHFKHVNDSLGHAIGDELLVIIARRLIFSSPEHSQVFRLGGDEFTLLLQGFSGPDDIQHSAQCIIDTLSQPVQIGPHLLRISVSIGITLIHADSDNPSGLLKNADLAMYAAKQAGRNTLAFFTPHLDLIAQRAVSLELDLRHAITHDQLTLAYQPLVSLANARLVGIEALCRWHHPDEGPIAPDDFITKAEETGLIMPLGRWVLTRAWQALRQFDQVWPEQLQLTVNLSVGQLGDPQLIETLQHLPTLYATPLSRLTLEVTEGILLPDSANAIATLHRLRSLGVHLAIDDFGTGFSSLSQLKQMPVDTLKIDRSFIQDLPADQDSATIVATIITMATQLGIQTVAEGVETVAQQQFLLAHDCYLGQGTLFSPALESTALIAYLRAATPDT